MPALSLMVLVVGTGGAGAAWLLLKLIALAANLAWYGEWSFAVRDIVPATGGFATVLVPVAGG